MADARYIDQPAGVRAGEMLPTQALETYLLAHLPGATGPLVIEQFPRGFSNLTYRGVLTNGPYRFTKHPAYLSKNLFWWIAGLPFLVTTDNVVDAIRNTTLLAAVSGVYYWRAKTEEWHLSADPAYRAYAGWMARHGPITRLLTPANLRNGKRPEAPAVSSAD